MTKQAGLQVSRNRTIVFVVSYALYLVCFGYSFSLAVTSNRSLVVEQPLLFVPLMLLAIYLVWELSRLFFGIANYCRLKEVPLPSNAVLVFLICVYAAAFPLLQSRLNRAS